MGNWTGEDALLSQLDPDRSKSSGLESTPVSNEYKRGILLRYI